MQNITIAIADDHHVYRRAITDLLITYGYDVMIEVSNGYELINSLTLVDKLPDICIVDINMPKKDGFDTVAEIKQRWPWVKVLAFTVSCDKWKKSAILERGADGFLLKQTPPAELNHTLQQMVTALYS